MKRLSREQIDARIEMYNEAIDHLGMSVHETEAETIQSRIVQRQIEAWRDKFIFYNPITPNSNHQKKIK